jgi:hypothetical protein
MTDSRMAFGMDRLPWLPDEPARAPNRSGGLLGWAAAAMLLVAGGSYWLGTRTAEPTGTASQPTATVPLPQPSADARPNESRATPPAAEPLVPSEPVRVSEPAVERQAQSAPEPARARERQVPPRRAPAEHRSRAPAPAAPQQHAAPIVAAPARPVAVPGAGRVVQIGAFGSRYQAKRGWWYMARAYPGVRRLRAAVIESRNTRGRRFYRFQIRTTSQAHSEILCQRMVRIRLSCAVVGLPWKPWGVER